MDNSNNKNILNGQYKQKGKDNNQRLVSTAMEEIMEGLNTLQYVSAASTPEVDAELNTIMRNAMSAHETGDRMVGEHGFNNRRENIKECNNHKFSSEDDNDNSFQPNMEELVIIDSVGSNPELDVLIQKALVRMEGNRK